MPLSATTHEAVIEGENAGFMIRKQGDEALLVFMEAGSRCLAGGESYGGPAVRSGSRWKREMESQEARCWGRKRTQGRRNQRREAAGRKKGKERWGRGKALRMLQPPILRTYFSLYICLLSL